MLRQSGPGRPRFRKRTLLAIGVIATLLVVRLLAEHLLGNYMESLLTSAVGTNVTIGAVSIKLLESSIAFKDAKVSNPEGYDDPYFGEASEIVVTVSILSSLGGPLSIHLIDVRELTAWLLKKNGKYNYEVLLSNLGPGTSDDDGDTVVTIDEIRLQNVKAEVHTLSRSSILPSELDPDSLGTVHVKFKEIELKDIGLEGGREAAAQQLSALLTKAIVTASAREASFLPVTLIGDSLNVGKTTLKIVGDQANATNFLEHLKHIEKKAGDLIKRSDKDSKPTNGQNPSP